jgi:hypothetical protein
MSYEPNLVFFNSQTLGRPHSLEALFGAVHATGYETDNLRMGRQFEYSSAWRGYGQHVDSVLAYEKKQLALDASNGQEGFRVTLWVYWEDPNSSRSQKAHTSVTTLSAAQFTRPECNPEHYSRVFLDLGIALYEALLPDFGWLDMCEPAGFTWYDDIEALAVPHLYWANFFGPRYVDKLGRECLLTAPVWSVEALADGGLLCVLSPSVGWGRRPIEAAVKTHLRID